LRKTKPYTPGILIPPQHIQIPQEQGGMGDVSPKIAIGGARGYGGCIPHNSNSWNRGYGG